ncbi:hypothetical protein GGF44_005243, partial [Coemansia sp. RSA 1694]
ATTAALALLTLSGATDAFDIINSANLNCRTGPTTKTKISKVYSLGDDVQIVCQTTGERVSGTDIWDKTPDNCYVLDYYLSTGFSGIFMPLCNGTSSAKTSSSPASTTATSKSGSESSSTPSDSKTSLQASSSAEPHSTESDLTSDSESDSSSSQTTSKNSAALST